MPGNKLNFAATVYVPCGKFLGVNRIAAISEETETGDRSLLMHLQVYIRYISTTDGDVTEKGHSIYLLHKQIF